jgi:3-methyladenine DNA glycosylase AlkD
MKALFDPDLDTLADEEDIAEFRRGFAAVGEDHRRILMILIPKLVALQERGDSAAALRLIAEIKTIVTGGEGALH